MSHRDRKLKRWTQFCASSERTEASACRFHVCGFHFCTCYIIRKIIVLEKNTILNIKAATSVNAGLFIQYVLPLGNLLGSMHIVQLRLRNLTSTMDSPKCCCDLFGATAVEKAFDWLILKNESVVISWYNDTQIRKPPLCRATFTVACLPFSSR